MGDQRHPQLVGVAIVGLAVLAGIWFGAGSREAGSAPLPGLAEVRTTSPDPHRILVHVSGAVRRPGLVELPPESRVADAVAAAGGATSPSALAGLNLAERLVDGQHVAVTDALPSEPAEASDSSGRVRLNQAAAADLEGLPGIGPVLAARIVEYREQHGPYQAVEDLLAVPGIGEQKLAALREALVVP